jgi:DNA-binding response OmpR family regulator
MRSSDQAILIVEHDDPTRELYLRELSRDYCVFACCDEHDGLELLRAHDICAVVLEPGPVGGHGWALLVTIKQTDAICAVPVILCSTLDERKRGMELGASAYLIKPVLPGTLLDAIRRVTRRIEISN